MQKNPQRTWCPPGAGTRRRILILQRDLMGKNLEELMTGIGLYSVEVMAECFSVILGDVFQSVVEMRA